jgi:hypothetical protein
MSRQAFREKAEDIGFKKVSLDFDVHSRPFYPVVRSRLLC